MELLASQCTASTELYVPPSQLGSLACGYGSKEDTAQVTTRLLQISGREASLIPVKKVVSGCTLPSYRDVREELEKDSWKKRTEQSPSECTHGTRKSGKRRKVSSSQLAAADVGAAVGLTVTAAEAMVVSSLLESETASGIILPSAVLEAAIQLRRARKSYGLDEYYVDEIVVKDILGVGDCRLNYTSINMKEEDPKDFLDDIHDCDIVEALADVGFVDPALENPGICGAETGEPEVYGLNWGRLKIRNTDHLICGVPREAHCNDATPETLPYHNSLIGREHNMILKPAIGELTYDMNCSKDVLPHSVGSKAAREASIEANFSNEVPDGVVIGSQNEEQDVSSSKQSDVKEVTRGSTDCHSIEKSCQVLAERDPNVIDGEQASNRSVGGTNAVQTLAYMNVGKCSTTTNVNFSKDYTPMHTTGITPFNEPTGRANTKDHCMAQSEPGSGSLTTKEARDGQAKVSLLENDITNERPFRWKLKAGVQLSGNEYGLDENLHMNAIIIDDIALRVNKQPPTDNLLHKSRWLGGWSDGSIMKPSRSSGYAVMETSYISDPWDIGTEDAGPEHSAALKRRRVWGNDNQKGIVFGRNLASSLEGTCGEPLGTREDLAGCQSQNSASGSSAPQIFEDPLCSFVPSSIPDAHYSMLPPEVMLNKRVDSFPKVTGNNADINKVSLQKDAKICNLLDDAVQVDTPLHSLRRAHVSSLRPYSTTATTSSLQLLLHAVGVAGDRQQEGDETIQAHHHDDGKRQIAVQLEAEGLGTRTNIVDCSLQFLDEDDECGNCSLEALAGVAAGASWTPDRKGDEMKGEKNKRKNCVNSNAEDVQELEGFPWVLDADRPQNASSLEALDDPSVGLTGHGWEDDTPEDDDTLHQWRTKSRKGNSEGQKKGDLLVPSGGEDILLKQRKRHTSEDFFCGCSSYDQSPPFVWPRGKMRRLRALRVVGTESDDFPVEGLEVVKEGAANDQLVIVVGSVATEEIQHIRANPAASFKVFSFTQEENLLLAQDETRDIPSIGNNIDRTCRSKKPTVKKTTEVLQEKTVKRRLLGDEPKEIPTSAKKLKDTGGKGRMKVVGKKGPLFGGLQFLLTGFQQQEKDDLTSSIEEHGGVVLLDIPRPSPSQARNTRGKEIPEKTTPIVIANQQVRTSKFLYGCAVGSPTLKATWLSESAAAKKLLPFSNYKHKPKATIKKLAVEDAPEMAGKIGNDQQEDSLFRNFQFLLHGNPTHCSQLKVLIQHAGGKVVSSVKCLSANKKDSENRLGLVVAEDLTKVPHSLRLSATSLKLPLVAEAWVVESLLTRRCLPLPSTTASLKNHMSKSKTQANLQESPLKLDESKNPLIIKLKKVSSQLPESNPTELQKVVSWTWIGMSSVKPIIAPPLISGVTHQVSDALAGLKRRQKRLYYSSFLSDGILYSLGDIIEIRPLSVKETIPFIARLEGLWSKDLNRSKSNKLGSRKKEENVVMRCRWFYHPFETGFPCTSPANAIYLSNHFDDGVHISRILRRVKMAMVVQGNSEPSNNWGAEGGLCSDVPMSSSSEQVPHYNCSYFYDHENESLHQIKVTST